MAAAAERPRFAWRIEGRGGAPVVAALGGISAHRRVFDVDDTAQRLVGRSWSARAARSTASRCACSASIIWAAAASRAAPRPAARFPSLSSFDQAEVLRRLLDHLGIDAAARDRRRLLWRHGGARLRAALSASASSSCWSSARPTAPIRCPLPGAACSGASCALHFRPDIAAEGLQLARALAMATYRSRQNSRRDLRLRRVDQGRCLSFRSSSISFARGRDYAARYRPESLLCLSESIDLHLRRGAPHRDADQAGGGARGSAGAARGYAGARRAPAAARLHEISSLHGHDAFLKEARR